MSFARLLLANLRKPFAAASVLLIVAVFCAGLALMVTVGGGGPVFTVKFSVDEKKKPVESQARIVAVCVPAASATEAEKFTEFAK